MSLRWRGLAGIIAAKRTGDLIPLCHPLALTSVKVDLSINRAENRVEIEAEVQTFGRTGVEMEALTAVAVAGLTVYDMCKAADREMVVSEIRLRKKNGRGERYFRTTRIVNKSRNPPADVIPRAVGNCALHAIVGCALRSNEWIASAIAILPTSKNPRTQFYPMPSIERFWRDKHRAWSSANAGA